jgi:hypothetical protein
VVLALASVLFFVGLFFKERITALVGSLLHRGEDGKRGGD